MRGDIIARIPQDLGRQLDIGSNMHVTICEEKCHSCNAYDATCVVAGETDSLGFEPIALCDFCYAAIEETAVEFYNGLDVVEREPAEGCVFFVSECTNHDGHGSWMQSFKSFREATAFYRRIERRAEPYQGLYPRAGIREIAESEAERLQEQRWVAERREMEWLEESEREIFAIHDLHGYEDEAEEDDWTDEELSSLFVEEDQDYLENLVDTMEDAYA